MIAQEETSTDFYSENPQLNAEETDTDQLSMDLMPRKKRRGTRKYKPPSKRKKTTRKRKR